MTTFDYLFKLIVIGNSHVGKTSICNRLMGEEFSEYVEPTIGIEFTTNYVDIYENRVKCQVWDASGARVFRSIPRTYYKEVVGIILVYDVTDKSSFNALPEWLEEIFLHNTRGPVNILLIGNKTDKTRRTVSTKEGKLFAEKHGFDFAESNSKNYYLLSRVFNNFISKITMDTSYLQNHPGVREGFAIQDKKIKILIEKSRTPSICPCLNCIIC